MKYKNIIKGIFIKRINRFIAICSIDNKEVTVYVPNTGRCKKLFIKGSTVYLSQNNSSSRKTQYSLISIYKNNILINIDSQAPNQLVEEAIKKGLILKDYKITKYKRECNYKNSRFDFYIENSLNRGFIEVKGVTLENKGHTSFPDAPTSRGLKHVEELIKAKEEGYDAFIIFVIQLTPVTDFIPNKKMQEEFSNALKKAINKGVSVLCYECCVKKDEINIKDRVPLGKF